VDTMNTDLEHRRARPAALYVKRPAEVVRQERLTTEVLTASRHQRWELRTAATRLQRRGEIKILALEVWHEELGEWRMPVRRLRPAPPAWRKPAIIGGSVMAGAGTLVGLIWWALATLAAMPGAIALLALGTVFTAGVARAHRRPRGGVAVDVRVRVR
jgi:hypothetical protein